MNPDDLDRILASEEALHPSSGFSTTVMARVREAASAPPPLPFPWPRFLLGALILSALAGLGGSMVAKLPAAGALRAGLAASLAVLAEAQNAMAIGVALASLIGTYLLVRLTLSWTGGRG